MFTKFEFWNVGKYETTCVSHAMNGSQCNKKSSVILHQMQCDFWLPKSSTFLCLADQLWTDFRTHEITLMPTNETTACAPKLDQLAESHHNQHTFAENCHRLANKSFTNCCMHIFRIVLFDPYVTSQITREFIVILKKNSSHRTHSLKCLGYSQLILTTCPC